MPDQNQIRTLSVRQLMDSSDYARGARDFVTANRDMSQSSTIVGTVVTQTQVKISNAADGVTRLVRAYDPAAAAAIKFQSDIVGLNKALETGKLSADEASRVYAGMVQKFNLAADGADILAQGFTGLGAVISKTNTEMAEFARATANNEEIRAQQAAVDALAKSYRSLAAEARALQATNQAQSNFNRSFGIAQPSSNSAADSASFFEEHFRQQDEANKRREGIDRLRAQQNGSNFASDLNSRLGVDGNGTSARASAAAFEEAAHEAELYAQRADTLKAILDPVGASQQRLNAELAEYGILLNRREIDAEQFAKAEALARQRHDQFVSSLNDTPDAAGGREGQFRRQNQMYQAFDVVGGLSSGQSLSMVAAQQGPQILQEYAAGGIASIKEDFLALKSMAGTVLTSLGPIGLAFGAIGIAAGAFYLLTRQETKTTDEVLKEHAANIKSLGEAYSIAEQKAKSYSEADKAIALAAENKSAEEVVKKQKEEIEALSDQFAASYAGRTPGFTLRADLGNFAKPFAELRAGTTTVEEFITQIQKIGDEKGMQQQAQDVIIYAKQLKLVNDQMLEHIRLQELVKFPNLTARTDEAAAQTKLRIENAEALADMQRQHAASLAGIGARSPAELAAAARANVLAQPMQPGEDQTNRQYRANAAAALAYAQAEDTLRRAKEDRVLQSNAALAAAQNELAMVGKTIAEQNRLRAAYEAEAQIREVAARDGVAADEAEIASARAKAAAIADINAKVAAGKLLQDQGYQIEQLRLEADLIGKSVDERNRATAALQAEQQLRQQGIDLLSQEGQQYVENAKRMADARSEIDRQNAAYQSLQQAGGSAIDALVTGTGSLKDRLKGMAEEGAKWLLQMSVANPLKNALTNTNLPTISDLFSGRPAIPGASAASTAMMNVTATTVMINGSPIGGLPSLPGGNTGGLAGLLGYSPAANTNVPVAANSNNPFASILSGNGNPLGFAGNYKSGTDPRLTDILNKAALQTPGYKVDAFSGYRAGDPRFHGQGLATDIRLTDPATGQVLNNYQDPSTFRAYEQFAQNAKTIQTQQYPELNDQFRWGGYFGGKPGTYGAMDQMHFDLGGSPRLGMAGGTWSGGLNPAQRSLFPGADSRGMNAVTAEQANSSLLKFSSTANSATKDLTGLGDSSSKVATSLTDTLGANSSLTKALPTSGQLPTNYFPPAPQASAGFNPLSIFSSIFSLFGFADGTDFSTGGPAIVGERGIEIVNMPRGSRVTPNHKLNGLQSDSPQKVVHTHEWNVTVSGNGDKELMERMRIAASESATAVVTSYNDNVLPQRVHDIQQNPRLVG